MIWNAYVREPTEIRYDCKTGRKIVEYTQLVKNVYAKDGKVSQYRVRPAHLWSSPTTWGPRYTSKLTYGISELISPPCKIGVRIDKYAISSVPNQPWTFSWDQAKYSREMLARIGGEGTNFSSSIAEADEALQTIRDVIATITQIRHCLRFPPGPKCAKNMRKWFNKHAKARGWKRAKEVSGDILAYNFGIAPLVDQLNDAYNRSLEYPLGNRVKKYTTTQKNNRTHEYSLYTYEESYKGKSDVYVEYNTPYAEYINVGNPLEWAWERTPFSFVVDWIIPVGSYIASLSVLQNVVRVVGTVSERRVLSAKQTSASYPAYDLVLPATKEYKQYNRTLVGPLVMPSLFRLSGNNSVNSLTNAVALLVQLRNH